ncbi:hypothetical protein LCGC14_1058900 [marine sediment metagenome]|uniref:Uncharacterized protein n=1 Tax=marine sediment metagenome TaxID=412755 RepID=A0A0F9N8L0_9ZZZZ
MITFRKITKARIKEKSLRKKGEIIEVLLSDEGAAVNIKERIKILEINKNLFSKEEFSHIKVLLKKSIRILYSSEQNNETPTLIHSDYIKCSQCGWENTGTRVYCDECEAKLTLDNVIYDFDKRIQIKQDSVSYIREGIKTRNGGIAYGCPACGWSYNDYTIDFCELCGEDLHKHDIPKSEYRLKFQQKKLNEENFMNHTGREIHWLYGDYQGN